MSESIALITGASGLLGAAVNQHLQSLGYTTIGLQHRKWTKCTQTISDFRSLKQLGKHLDLVVNLAGAPIAGGLWTKSRKAKLEASRIGVTYNLIHALKVQNISVSTFISGSAIGFYGTGERLCKETDSPGSDYSARLCAKWEEAAQEASTIADQVTMIRTGLVLSRRGGYLAPLLPFARLGLHMKFGNGKQGISWIHERDWINALKFIIEHNIHGPVNLTAPNPISQKGFTESLAQHTVRGITLPVLSPLLYPAGEMKTLFLDGQFVIPDRLSEAGFQFKHPHLDDALRSLFNHSAS